MLFAPVVAAAIFLPRRSGLKHIFSSRPLIAFGKYSYCIYLIHILVGKLVMHPHLLQRVFLSKIRGSGIPGQILFDSVTMCVALAAAWVSWNLFEKYFLKLKRYFPSSKALPRGITEDQPQKAGTAPTAT